MMMEKIFLYSFTFLLIFSCNKYETEYLYNKYDDQDYRAALAAMQEKCESENEIFTILQKTNEFKNYFKDKTEVIYKMVEKKSENGSNEVPVYTYVRISDFDDVAKTMRLSISSSENGTQPFYIEYSQKDNADILATVTTGVCSKEYGKGSWNKSYLLFTHSREDIIVNSSDTSKKRYEKIDEKFEMWSGYPTLLYRWTGKISSEQNKTGTVETSVYENKEKNAIEVITRSQCDKEPGQSCAPVYDPTLNKCQLLIDTLHYKSDAPVNTLTSFVNC